MLGTSSHHRSSHGTNNLISVTVRKENESEKAGIRLEKLENGRVCVAQIALNGLFHGSEVEVGDIVLGINGVRLAKGEGAEKLVNVISEAKSKVTMVVKKNPNKRTSTNPSATSLVSSDDDDDDDDDGFQVTDSHKRTSKTYKEKARHNADGSINYNYKGGDKKVETNLLTISAPKQSKKQDLGVSLEVHNKKLYVSKVDPNSAFGQTELVKGDCIVSINDMDFRGFADKKYAELIISKAATSVTFIIDRDDSSRHSPATKTMLANSKSRKQRGGDDDSTSMCSSATAATSTTTTTIGNQGKFVSTESVIVAPKKYRFQNVGLTLEKRDGALVVSEIARDSIFKDTSLVIGDRIVSINDHDYSIRPDEDAAKRTMKEAKETVSLVVSKGKSIFESEQFDLDSSKSNLVWQ